MNADWIITAFVFIDMLIERLVHHHDKYVHITNSKVILMVVVAAQYVHYRAERAACILHQPRYLSGYLTVPRFNRRLYQLADWCTFLAITLGALLGRATCL